MDNKNKKILTLEDLVSFYSKYKRSTTFSSKKSGYQLAVQVPASFEVDNYEDDTLLFCTAKLFHIGRNRNNSSVTEEAAQKAMKGIAYKPLLANFCEIDGVRDFTSHDMIINDDGIEYIEHQIGCFTADEPYMEYDEELDKTYVYAKVAIPKDYTDAVDIIERKNGTKISVELLVNELRYNAAEKVLELTDVIVQGATCLGKNPETGKNVEEGMLGARLDIKDFSRKNNSIIDFSDEEHSKLIDTLERLNTTLSKFNNIDDATASTKDYGKEENNNVENEKLVNEEVTEVEETEETTVTETESTEETTVETEAKKKRCEEETVEGNPEVVEVEEAEINSEGETTTEETGETTDGTGETETFEVVEEVKNFSKTFELSHDDIRGALYELLKPYEEADNEWYWIMEVFNDHFVYQGLTGKYYGQDYSTEGDTVSFEGERYELYLEYLKASEKAELDNMRSNYSSIESELNKYKEAELNAQREAVFNDEAYADFVETDSFKKIKENINTYSIDELRTACDLAFAKEVKNKGTFALNHENKDEKKKTPSFFAFARQETDSSFLDSLLKK